MKKVALLAALAALLTALALVLPALAQVPAGATSITITQVNTLAGITTWTFSDPSGTYYLQTAAYISTFIPGGAGVVTPIPPLGIWLVPPAAPATPTASADLTAIASDDGNAIIDAQLQAWTVVSGVVLVNGAPIGFSSGVVKLVIVKGVLWQQNTAGDWYYWSTAAVTWNGGAAPI